MAISLRCSSCGETLQVADELAGRTVACSKCQTIVPVPGVASDAVSADLPRSRPPSGKDRSDNERRREPVPKSSSATIWIVLGILGVAILGVTCIGVALLVPAVQKVREAAARVQSMNNMKMCSLAVHMYHDTNRKLPDAFGPSPALNKDVSLWFHLLPYLEQQNVYQAGMTNAVVPPFIAPSDPYVPDPAGVVTYAGNIRVFGYETLIRNNHPVNQPGVALTVPAGQVLSGLMLNSVKDGTSNTIMLTTRYGNCGGKKTLYAADPLQGGFMGAGSHSTPATPQPVVTATFQVAPRESDCLPTSAVFGHSFGRGGMSVSLLDGAVRNVLPTMSPITFGRALCPNDMQALGVDWADE